jgi:hypothetical protein
VKVRWKKLTARGVRGVKKVGAARDAAVRTVRKGERAAAGIVAGRMRRSLSVDWASRVRRRGSGGCIMSLKIRGSHRAGAGQGGDERRDSTGPRDERTRLSSP